MKTTKRILLILLLVFIIAITAVGIWQRENIKSFINSMKYTEEEISQLLEENAKKMDDIVEKTDYIDVRKGGLTPEEEAAVASGEITSAEAVEIIRGKTTLEEIRAKKKAESENSSEEPKTPDKPIDNSAEKNPDKPIDKAPENNPEQSGGNVPEKTPEKKPEDKNKEETPENEMTDEVSNIVAELYVVKSDFIARLESIGNDMYYEYTKIARYDRSKIDSIIEKNLPVVAELEYECDTKMDSLLKELEAALKKGGGDLALVNEIRQYYKDEKVLKKTQYFDRITIGISD